MSEGTQRTLARVSSASATQTLGLRRGHDQRPGVGEPQGGRQVDREAEVGRLQWRGLQLQVDLAGAMAPAVAEPAADGIVGRSASGKRRWQVRRPAGVATGGDGRGHVSAASSGHGRSRRSGETGAMTASGQGRSAHEALDGGGDRRRRGKALDRVPARSTARLRRTGLAGGPRAGEQQAMAAGSRAIEHGQAGRRSTSRARLACAMRSIVRLIRRIDVLTLAATATLADPGRVQPARVE